MITSFRDRSTEAIAAGRRVGGFGVEVQKLARRKLRMIQAATKLDDLRVPPGNRLEKLTGDRCGQYSIRVNDQYRICFAWIDGAAHDVELVDYHR
jgi:proteic killer suppression protein